MGVQGPGNELPYLYPECSTDTGGVKAGNSRITFVGEIAHLVAAQRMQQEGGEMRGESNGLR